MPVLWNRFAREESGQGLVEYALIIALVAVGLIVVITLLRNAVGNVFNTTATKLNEMPGTPYQPSAP